MIKLKGSNHVTYLPAVTLILFPFLIIGPGSHSGEEISRMTRLEGRVEGN